MDNFCKETTFEQNESLDRDSLSRFAHAVAGISKSPKVAATNLMINSSGPYEYCGSVYLNGSLPLRSYRRCIRRLWNSVLRKLLRKLGYSAQKDMYFRDAKLVSGYMLVQEEDDQGVFIHFVCNLSKVAGPNGKKLTISDLGDAFLESRCILSVHQPVPLIVRDTLEIARVNNPSDLWMESIYSDHPELFNISGRRLQLIWR